MQQQGAGFSTFFSKMEKSLEIVYSQKSHVMEKVKEISFDK